MPGSTFSFELEREKGDCNPAAFDVQVEADQTAPSKIHVYTRPQQAAAGMHEFYYASLVRIDSDTMQWVMLSNTLPTEYHGLGLSAELSTA